jgi:hypothetical protein
LSHGLDAFAATVGPILSSHLRFARVVIERDLGQSVYVAVGVEPSDRVVKIGSAELAEGTRVDVAK